MQQNSGGTQHTAYLLIQRPKGVQEGAVTRQGHVLYLQGTVGQPAGGVG